MKKKSFRLIHGVAYPNLVPSKDQPDKIACGTFDPEVYYNDPAVRLSDEDIKKYVGKPICVEHDESDVVGEITAAYKDSKGHMRVNAKIFTDSTRGQDIFEQIQNGNLSGLSVGYRPVRDNKETDKILYKNMSEVSLCNIPFFQGAEVRVCASKKQTVAPANTILLKINAMEEKTPETNIAPEAENQDAQELLKHADKTAELNSQLQAQLDRLRQENEKMLADRQRLEELEAREAEREQLRVAETKKQADEFLAKRLEQYKQDKGEDAEIPDVYKNFAYNAFKNEDAAPMVEVMASGVRSYQELLAKYNALEKEASVLRNNQKVVTEKLEQANVAASKKRVREAVSGNTAGAEGTGEEEPVIKQKTLFERLFAPAIPQQMAPVAASGLKRQKRMSMKEDSPDLWGRLMGGNFGGASFQASKIKIEPVDFSKSRMH